MKRIFIAVLATISSLAAIAATTTPPQLINPNGSTAGQAIVSTGSSTAPVWGAVSSSSLAPISDNRVLGNASGGSATPTPLTMPSCSTANSALKWANSSGFSCGAAFSLTSGNLSQFAATTSAQLLGVLSDETGSGSVVFGTSPTIGTPTINTPTLSGGTINNATVGATTASTGRFTTLATTDQSKVISNNQNAQSIPHNTSTVVTTWTSVLNQGAHFNNSSGVYTAPSAGTYRVAASLQFASVAWTAGNVIAIQVRQNNTLIYQNTHIVEANVSQPLYTYPISVILNCAASDTISISVLHTQGGAVSLAASATNGYVMIDQMP